MKSNFSLILSIIVVAASIFGGFMFIQNQSKINTLRCYDLALATNTESGEFIQANEITTLEETKQWSTQYKKLNEEVFAHCVNTVK